ncbi:hypothetical protein [Synechococcus sp. C9]|uniref:hypothetical protein n=1 Tax=Synechococcus sp. C9 TaxID=102119 RepID=UPI001FF45736|nr:hypothetical protein [Synechococcus sp. C9]
MDFSAVSTCILPTTSLERDPQQFWGNLTLEQRQEWLHQLRTLYSVVLNVRNKT